MKVRVPVHFLRNLLLYNIALGSITHLVFPSRSHLMSASEDGTLCLFRARDWAVLRALKGHKGRVNAIAIHPSGKVALSVGKDRALRMWDLMRGKGVASTKLGKGACCGGRVPSGYNIRFCRGRSCTLVNRRLEVCCSVWLHYGRLCYGMFDLKIYLENKS